jgi:hypothetical protein
MQLQEVVVTEETFNWMALLPGLVLPLIVAVVEDPSFTKPVRVAISLGVTALAAAVITLWVTHGDWKDWLAQFVALFFISIVALYGLWKPLGVTGKLETLIGRNRG